MGYWIAIAALSLRGSIGGSRSCTSALIRPVGQSGTVSFHEFHGAPGNANGDWDGDRSIFETTTVILNQKKVQKPIWKGTSSSPTKICLWHMCQQYTFVFVLSFCLGWISLKHFKPQRCMWHAMTKDLHVRDLPMNVNRKFEYQIRYAPPCMDA
jgi:hypothetical protein